MNIVKELLVMCETHKQEATKSLIAVTNKGDDNLAKYYGGKETAFTLISNTLKAIACNERHGEAICWLVRKADTPHRVYITLIDVLLTTLSVEVMLEEATSWLALLLIEPIANAAVIPMGQLRMIISHFNAKNDLHPELLQVITPDGDTGWLHSVDIGTNRGLLIGEDGLMAIHKLEGATKLEGIRVVSNG